MSLNPEMLTLARESRGFTQTALAEKLGVSQGKISKYETGLLEVLKEELARISAVLDYPEEFFFQGDTIYGLTDVVYYRKRQGLPISEQKIIEAQANVLRMRVTRLLRGVDLESPNQFPRLDVDSFADGPQEIARRVRADWHLPSGPIRSVTGAIESAGGFVFRRPFGTTQLDAVIQSPNGLCPLFLINSNVPAGDRLRFTLAHEIGHVVMRNSLSPDPEKEANDFASEFLMPAREIAGDLNDFGLAKALRLKPYWKVSIQALIRRAYDLGKISPRKYRSLFTQLSASGWRVREPIPIPVETPTLIHDIVTVHVDQLNMNYGEICRTLVSREDDFRSQFCAEDPRLRGFGIVG